MARKTYAIGAHELRDHHILVGDHISPFRFGTGTSVTVNHDMGDTVLVLAAGRQIDYPAAHTVYVSR